MDFITWQELSHLKARLLELAVYLLEDDVIDRERIAFDLLTQLENLDDIEQKCSYQVRRVEMHRLWLEIEQKQLEKEKSSTAINSEGTRDS